MRSDGCALPDLTQTLVLRQLGLVRTDQLPDLAARWLAADMTDSPSTRRLAWHNPRDSWAVDQLLADAAAETGPLHPRATHCGGRARDGGECRVSGRVSGVAGA